MLRSLSPYPSQPKMVNSQVALPAPLFPSLPPRRKSKKKQGQRRKPTPRTHANTSLSIAQDFLGRDSVAPRHQCLLSGLGPDSAWSYIFVALPHSGGGKGG